MAAQASKSTYVVLRPILHHKKVYKRGEGISLADNEAGHLLQTTAIALPSEALEATLVSALTSDVDQDVIVVENTDKDGE